MSCIRLERRKKGLFDVLEERKEPALLVAKEMWLEAGALCNGAVLTSGLKLCTQLDSSAGLQWGMELWRQTEQAGG